MSSRLDDLYEKALDAFKHIGEVNAQAEELGEDYEATRIEAVSEACDAADAWQHACELQKIVEKVIEHARTREE